jgi:hypothetical protein
MNSTTCTGDPVCFNISSRSFAFCTEAGVETVVFRLRRMTMGRRRGFFIVSPSHAFHSSFRLPRSRGRRMVS